ncbi:hypothetical protein I6E36_05850 [Fusobacterium mortiferum]|uniref:hypothetical protein n=1 Tax=Fusobacterium mortiferum TaxID=850 RepID=UPI001F199B2A|nr:hypothetical protein [Fusobacterium mortiferum]MCF2627604.1 hypothetical protein [Fusobacterium mortiferum]
MSKIIAFMGFCANKLIDLFSKKAKSGEKAQDIEIKKINTFSKTMMWIVIIILLMCMLASLFPKLAITDWWFEKADIAIEYIFSS